MKPYFNSEERRIAVRDAVNKWHGTPFHESLCKPQQGTNCVRFVAAVLGDCGIPVDLIQLPKYSLTHGYHHKESQLTEWLHGLATMLEEKHIDIKLMPVDREEPFLYGDLVVLKHKQTPHHLGICDALGRVAHIHRVAGFVREPERLHRSQKTLHSIFRIFE